MELPHPPAEALDLATVLAVLGDGTRLAILRRLADAPGPLACATFAPLGSKTKLSYHLARLREAGVTRTEVRGTSRLVTLRRADLDARFPGLLSSVLAGAAPLRPRRST